jgi:hypothetical protein
MPGNYLTTASQIMCPHGGQAVLLTANAQVTAVGAQLLLETDVHPVVGCPFTIGLKYSPCIRIEWSAAATKTTVNGTAPLVQSSIGKCINAEGAPQGVAIIVSTQPKGFGQ